MPPPKTPQKHKALTSRGNNDGAFSDSPLTQSPPLKTPPHKHTKAAKPEGSHRSQRTNSKKSIEA
ncbi:hypothetical protein BDM02DRAFT_3121199 [Thelephora ganbajun]|uniref:Uncharacterized protein n=1 Tax=Thelephora ganbajun TaxID=370292 RepID=A0ACB6Z6T6_THEGA|nr:hypothetical protein BDM02DRAFT_3121199 [Thelephora ganbajun]